MVQIVRRADGHVVQGSHRIALELVHMFRKTLELGEKIALRRNAIDDAHRIVDVIRHRQMIAGVLYGTHVARRYIAGGANEGKFFHIGHEEELQAKNGKTSL